MDYERVAILDALTSFVDDTVVPMESANAHLLAGANGPYGPNGSYSPAVLDLMRTVRESSADLGYYTLFAPESVGGGGLGAEDLFLVWERLHERYGPKRILPYETVAHWTSGPSFLLGHLSAELPSSIHESIMAGTRTTCFAMSEPDAGSDVMSMSTAAKPDGDGWRISGTKQWISNAHHADWVFVFVATGGKRGERGHDQISCLLVPTDSVGFNRDGVIRLFGDTGGNEAILSFDNVYVGAEHVVGDVGRGFELALEGVAQGKLYNAGRCVGLARWAIETALNYARDRRTFGRPILDYQGVSFQLADCVIEYYAARSMALDCARKMDDGAKAILELAAVKAYATEMCFNVYDRCMQVLGGMGITNDTKLYDGWHLARTVRIADGTAEIMRRTIVNRLQRGEFPA
ncbi:MAG TPA: acyl-CoA dehydrogenase [Pseudonocardiaceae bacterium]|nr:acyl-CoA dehydrogenase [Pseudonocardiaceae bacterium]